ncbi:hypothetical protein CAPTEDRAFT_204456 [Capitella teleta]|uniref:Uncharacterized protein n=1 Tax=Capitella teleta TaxID=283909 RepID=R7V8A1_CAPTE|nr:hypothetical protein CAPTEDRAFT_204456 [Capitella teleta]|eukprot:ELU14712.1 hypothetical protein CAPTEDRAFT_204456 [Capitella teleta]
MPLFVLMGPGKRAHGTRETCSWDQGNVLMGSGKRAHGIRETCSWDQGNVLMGPGKRAHGIRETCSWDQGNVLMGPGKRAHGTRETCSWDQGNVLMGPGKQITGVSATLSVEIPRPQLTASVDQQCDSTGFPDGHRGAALIVLWHSLFAWRSLPLRSIWKGITPKKTTSKLRVTHPMTDHLVRVTPSLQDVPLGGSLSDYLKSTCPGYWAVDYSRVGHPLFSVK